MRVHVLMAITAALVLCGCSPQSKENSAPPLTERPAGGGLYAYGSLDGMALAGQSEERVKLESLLPDDKLYAVGALSSLRGEVTIVAGQPYLAYAQEDGSVGTLSAVPAGEGAALLVVASPNEWREVTTVDDIVFANLESELNRLAALAGLPADQPFAFTVTGPVENLRWHVIDGRGLSGAARSIEEYNAAAIRGELHRGAATLVGVYSDHHRGVFTYAGRNAHVHCVIDEPLLTAHVEQVDLPAGSTIRFSLR